MSGPQPEIAVLGPQDVALMGALGVLEGLVGVADGGVGPAASGGVQVGSVGFDVDNLIADPVELVGDIRRDRGEQLVPFAGDDLLGAGGGLGAVGDPGLAAAMTRAAWEVTQALRGPGASVMIRSPAR